MQFPETLTDLQNAVYTLLAEAFNTTAADLRSGTGAAAIITTPTEVTDLLNKAFNDIARYAYPVYSAAQITSWTPALQQKLAAIVATITQDTVWAVNSVQFDGSPLTFCGWSPLRTFYASTYPNDTGTPLYWYDVGSDALGVYPKSTGGAKVLSVEALVIPARLLNAGLAITAAPQTTSPTTITTASAHNLVTGRQVQIQSVGGNTAVNGTWTVTVLTATTFTIPVAGSGVYTAATGTVDDLSVFQPDQNKLAVYQAAGRTCVINAHDPSMRARGEFWLGEHERGREALLAKLWEQDPWMARRLFPSPQGGTE